MEDFSLIESTSWPSVFESWRNREEEIWREHYVGRGFETWQTWREQWTIPLKLADRTWNIYKVEDPFLTIPNLLVGAYKGWRKYYPEGKRIATFADIAKHPELPENPKVKSMLADFPSPTEIIILKHGDQHILFEGTHRCATIALAASAGERFSVDMTAAITEFGEEEGELFEKCYTQRDE